MLPEFWFFYEFRFLVVTKEVRQPDMCARDRKRVLFNLKTWTGETVQENGAWVGRYFQSGCGRYRLCMWNRFIRLATGTNSDFLRRTQWSSGFHKRREISSFSKWLSFSKWRLYFRMLVCFTIISCYFVDLSLGFLFCDLETSRMRSP
jgi:hypothetical protein